MEYLFCLIILILGCFIKTPKDRKFWYVFEFVLLTTLMALRYRVGGDTQAYYEFFYKDYINLSLNDFFSIKWSNELYQPLWILLNLVSKSIYNDFTVVQIIHALFVNAVIFWFIWKNTKTPFRVIIFYFLFDYLYFNTEIMRESIAVCIFLLSYSFLKERKYIKYFIMSSIAFGFHTSAIILFPFPLIYGVLNKKINLKLLMIICVIVFILAFTPIVSDLVQAVGLLGMEKRYYSYTTYYQYNLNAYIKLAIEAFVMFILILIVNSNYNNKDLYKDRFALNMCLLFSLFAICLPISVRFLNYFKIQLAILMVENIFYIIKNKFIVKKIYISIMTLIFVAFFMFNKTLYYTKDMTNFNYGKTAKNYNRWYPYHSILDKQNPAVITKQNIFFNSMKN